MSAEVRALEPKVLWNHFEDLNAVPRPSKNEERVTAFMKAFGESLGLETEVDDMGNVLIRKPATAGMENRMGVVLQSHLDMVHQKNADTDFDFDTMGIQSYVDGEWVKAKGTTLGSDNGMGVAAAMSILSSTDIPHGPIEALFTIDEETGMTGAFALQHNWCKGDILLNMDYEDEGELCIGCAGGMDTNINGTYAEESVDGLSKFNLKIKGLKGGHSGVEIHLQRGNSNKVSTHLLWRAARDFGARVMRFDGGSLRNAIPREAFLDVAVPADQADAFKAFVKEFEAEKKADLRVTDPNFVIELSEGSEYKAAMSSADQSKYLNALYAVPNGVYKWSNDVENLVETSTNLSRVLLENGKALVQLLTRSSVDGAKFELGRMIESAFAIAGAEVEHGGAYPGWAPNPNSSILKVAQSIYQKLFDHVPEVMAIHAGLECGIIGNTHPNLDMIAFGPTIRNPHSPDEMVNIETVQKFWTYLLEILANIPSKN
jgi:dipeptidase D